VYYSPAFLRQSAQEHSRLALYALAEVYRAARALYPLSNDPSECGRTVTVRIDQLKASTDAAAAAAACASGHCWMMVRKSAQEAQVECHPLTALQALDAVDYRLLRLWNDALPPAQPAAPMLSPRAPSQLNV